jgi:hypothetical protein
MAFLLGVAINWHSAPAVEGGTGVTIEVTWESLAITWLDPIGLIVTAIGLFGFAAKEIGANGRRKE